MLSKSQVIWIREHDTGRVYKAELIDVSGPGIPPNQVRVRYLELVAGSPDPDVVLYETIERVGIDTITTSAITHPDEFEQEFKVAKKKSVGAFSVARGGSRRQKKKCVQKTRKHLRR